MFPNMAKTAELIDYTNRPVEINNFINYRCN